MKKTKKSIKKSKLFKLKSPIMKKYCKLIIELEVLRDTKKTEELIKNEIQAYMKDAVRVIVSYAKASNPFFKNIEFGELINWRVE